MEDIWMGRPKDLPVNFHTHDFHKLSKAEKDPRAKIRLLGLAYIQQGKTYDEISELLNISARTPLNWLKNFKRSGFSVLKQQPGQGKKPMLPNSENEAFKAAVLKLQAGRKGGRIRGKDVQLLLQEQWDIDCNLRTVYKILERAELVWISARSKHPNHNKEAQESFKKTSKKK